MLFRNQLLRLRATWQPDMFHGWGRDRRFFEGWYFKLVTADRSTALAVIPGISRGADGSAHAFVQVMDGQKMQSNYHRFEAELFRPSTQKFEVELADNFFSAQKIRLDLPGLRGELEFENPSTWPKMLGAPGIMGWYSFVPFMQCYHGVVSLHHEIRGSLIVDNQRVTFEKGSIGYIEKDWGRSFPRGYVWMQTNHFDGPERVSAMASVAHIPWLGSHFVGFIGGFFLDGRLWKFATYNGSRHELRVADGTVSLIFKNRKSEIRLLGRQAAGADLISPLGGAMTGKIQESLLAEIDVELFEGGRRIFEGTGRMAGMELAGALEEIVSK